MGTVLDAPGRRWVSLLGSFACGGKEPFEVPLAGKRLIAYLALQRHPVGRLRAACILWPDVPEERALASLRSTVWKLRRCTRDVVEVSGDRLRVAAGVEVDVDAFVGRSHLLVQDEPVELTSIEPCSFGVELLAEWYDDWVVFERERIRQLALHGLEALSRRHLVAGNFAAAVESAYVAVSLEPLRESAQSRLIDAYFAQGNIAEGLEHYAAYCRLLDAELGLGPGPRLSDRVAEELRNGRARRLGPGADWTGRAVGQPAPSRRSIQRRTTSRTASVDAATTVSPPALSTSVV